MKDYAILKSVLEKCLRMDIYDDDIDRMRELIEICKEEMKLGFDEEKRKLNGEESNYFYRMVNRHLPVTKDHAVDKKIRAIKNDFIYNHMSKELFNSILFYHYSENKENTMIGRTFLDAIQQNLEEEFTNYKINKLYATTEQ
ncbi:MAG: hypothetical protein LBQ68_02710 [Clostridiales bacterium]|jgi:hypothetical protein|nr:hypothetical protein [Clostridiales bacterium]